MREANPVTVQLQHEQGNWLSAPKNSALLRPRVSPLLQAVVVVRKVLALDLGRWGHQFFFFAVSSAAASLCHAMTAEASAGDHWTSGRASGSDSPSNGQPHAKSWPLSFAAVRNSRPGLGLLRRLCHLRSCLSDPAV